MNFTDEEINKIINSHIKTKEYRRNYYRNKYQNDPVHRELQLERSKNYYHKNKKLKKETKTGVYHLAKKRYDYFKKNNNIQKFIDKYPEDYEMWFSKED